MLLVITLIAEKLLDILISFYILLWLKNVICITLTIKICYLIKFVKYNFTLKKIKIYPEKKKKKCL